MDMSAVDMFPFKDAIDITRADTAPGLVDSDVVSIGWIAAPSLTRDCLKELLTRIDARLSITTFDSTQHLVDATCSGLDLIVYHPQGTNSFNISELSVLTTALPESMPLIVVSDATRLSPDIVSEIIRHDVSGFIYTRDTSITVLISSIAFVKSGGCFMPKTFYSADNRPEPLGLRQPGSRPLLTPRETEVLKLIRQGKPNKLIAHALNLSSSTTKIHVRNVMHKLGATNRTQAAIEALPYLRVDTEN